MGLSEEVPYLFLFRVESLAAENSLLISSVAFAYFAFPNPELNGIARVRKCLKSMGGTELTPFLCGHAAVNRR